MVFTWLGTVWPEWVHVQWLWQVLVGTRVQLTPRALLLFYWANPGLVGVPRLVDPDGPLHLCGVGLLVLHARTRAVVVSPSVRTFVHLGLVQR